MCSQSAADATDSPDDATLSNISNMNSSSNSTSSNHSPIIISTTKTDSIISKSPSLLSSTMTSTSFITASSSPIITDTNDIDSSFKIIGSKRSSPMLDNPNDVVKRKFSELPVISSSSNTIPSLISNFSKNSTLKRKSTFASEVSYPFLAPKKPLENSEKDNFLPSIEYLFHNKKKKIHKMDTNDSDKIPIISSSVNILSKNTSSGMSLLDSHSLDKESDIAHLKDNNGSLSVLSSVSDSPTLFDPQNTPSHGETIVSDSEDDDDQLITVNIETLFGMKFSLNLFLNDTISGLKFDIYDVTELYPENQILIFKNEPIPSNSDNVTLKEFGFQKSTNIKLLVNISGGPGSMIHSSSFYIKNKSHSVPLNEALKNALIIFPESGVSSNCKSTGSSFMFTNDKDELIFVKLEEVPFDEAVACIDGDDNTSISEMDELAGSELKISDFNEDDCDKNDINDDFFSILQSFHEKESNSVKEDLRNVDTIQKTSSSDPSLESIHVDICGLQSLTITSPPRTLLTSIDSASRTVNNDSSITVDPLKCFRCSKRLRITNSFQCRCGRNFCSIHRYSDRHECSFDYVSFSKQELTKNNPLIQKDKLEKF